MPLADVTQSAETPADFGSGGGATAQRWISELDLAERDRANWLKTAKSIIQRYRDEERSGTSVTTKTRRYSLFWSNLETLAPAILARTPTPIVGRRWPDADPIGRIASQVLERGLKFSLDAMAFKDLVLAIRKDYLLVARAQAWVRYIPHMQTMPGAPNAPAPIGVPDLEGGEQQNAENGEITTGAASYEVVAWEEVIADHVAYDDFLHNVAREWSEVRWVARCCYMTREELVERFGEDLGKSIPLDHGAERDQGPGDQAEQWAKAAIYEIWDKPSRSAIWISKSVAERTLDERDDPLGLQDFFPCPRPCLGTTAPDSLLPIPDYVYYETQLRDINTLTQRIGVLEDAIKLRGFYAAGGEQKQSLQDLWESETGTLIPVDSWAAFAEKGGVKGLIEWVPLDAITGALTACLTARKQLIDDVYQVTGISDIMRGDTDPDETAAAQHLKSNWGSSRVRDKQNELSRFCEDLLKIMGQVIAAKFDPKTLAAMTDVQMLPDMAAKQSLMAQMQAQAQQAQVAAQAMMAQQQQMQPQGGQPQQPQQPPQPPPPFRPPPEQVALLQRPTWEDVLGLLRNNTLRAFRIEIETDSTVEPNDQEEQARWAKFVQSIGELMAKSLPLVQLYPQAMPMVAELIKATVRRFRVGREAEEVIDKCLDDLQAQSGQGGQQPGQQPPHGPNPQVEAMKGQAAVMGGQARMMDAQTRQFEAQTDRQSASAGAQLESQRIQAENMRSQADRHADIGMHATDIRAELQKSVDHAVGRHLVHEINAPYPKDPTQP